MEALRITNKMGTEFKLEDYESDIKGMYHEEHIILFRRKIIEALEFDGWEIKFPKTLKENIIQKINSLAGSSLCR